MVSTDTVLSEVIRSMGEVISDHKSKAPRKLCFDKATGDVRHVTIQRFTNHPDLTFGELEDAQRKLRNDLRNCIPQDFSDWRFVIDADRGVIQASREFRIVQ